MVSYFFPKFYNKFYTLVGQLSEHNFDTHLFNQVTVFTKQVAIVPVSSKTGEGVPNLLMILIGLAQQINEFARYGK